MKIKKILALSLVVNTVFLSNFTTNTFAKEKNSGNLQSSYMSELKANNGNSKNNGNGNGHNKDKDTGNDDDNDANPGNNHHIKFHKFAQTIIKFDGDTIDLKTINQGAKSLKDLKYEINVYDTSGNMMGDGTITINVGELLPKKVAKNALIFTNVAYINFTVKAIDFDGQVYEKTQTVYNTKGSSNI
jgi:hypothetical protein